MSTETIAKNLWRWLTRPPARSLPYISDPESSRPPSLAFHASSSSESSPSPYRGRNAGLPLSTAPENAILIEQWLSDLSPDPTHQQPTQTSQPGHSTNGQAALLTDMGQPLISGPSLLHQPSATLSQHFPPNPVLPSGDSGAASPCGRPSLGTDAPIDTQALLTTINSQIDSMRAIGDALVTNSDRIITDCARAADHLCAIRQDLGMLRDDVDVIEIWIRGNSARVNDVPMQRLPLLLVEVFLMGWAQASAYRTR